MTGKSTQAIVNPNARCEMLDQFPELQRPYLRTIGFQAVEVSFSGVAWFVAVMWLNFVGGPQLGLTKVIVGGMFVMLLTLFLRAITMVIDDPAGGFKFRMVWSPMRRSPCLSAQRGPA